MTLERDPRAHPKIRAAMQQLPAAGDLPAVSEHCSYEQALQFCQAFEDQSAAANPMLLASLPEAPTVTVTTETIQGVDANPIELFLHAPTDVEAPRPCVIHIHGGGMVLMSATDPGFIRFRNSLAASGMLVVGVEFRNGGGRLGNHPFPAGLNDCAAAVQWVHANRARLGVSSLVIAGESGGGNLALATALKAKQEQWLEQIDGVYAMCPYISGCYAQPLESLPSLRENDGYLLDMSTMRALVKVYDPDGKHGTDPLAWPYHADAALLQGLPAHVISVNELDPLRDEGLAYYRKLLAAGVPANGRTVHGTPHAGDQMFPDVVPEIYEDTVRSIRGFAGALV